MVAPFAGAWIETKEDQGGEGTPDVAPFAGAWIETTHLAQSQRPSLVAPFAGAWIETPTAFRTSFALACRALRGRVD